MDCGIDVAPVNKALFRTKSAVRLAMAARMVAGMERCDAGRVVVMQICPCGRSCTPPMPILRSSALWRRRWRVPTAV